jgi:CCR4-NOT transcription complex subunit 1
MIILQSVEVIDGEIKLPFSQLRMQKELLGSVYYDAFPYIRGLARVPDAVCPKSNCWIYRFNRPQLYSANLVQPADLIPEESDYATTQHIR